MPPWALSAADALARLRGGELGCEELVRSCLQRIEETEPAVRAWVHLDPEHALRQARAADEHRRGGADPGPLHGLPVGVKDIFDTREWPTECGTPLMAGRRPRSDTHVVSLLKAGGRGDHGQDGDHRACAVLARKDHESARPAPYPGGIVERLRGGGGHGHGPPGDRQPDQRLGNPSGRVLRSGRL